MIKILVMDVDGTLTDGKIYVSEQGEFMKAFHVKDGLGIHDLLSKYGITPVVITGRESNILAKRCMELEIVHIYQNVFNKYECLLMILKKLNVSLEETAYIGDDINDLACMKACGVSGCPADAVDEVKQSVNYICNAGGGNGAVREFINWIMHI